MCRRASVGWVILPWVGVDAGRWATIMCIFSILALPAALIEYYFTKERITEESADLPNESKKTVSIQKQLSVCLKSKYWVIFMLINIVWQLQQNFYGASVVYYSNWVLGTYNDGITQTLINAVGQAPLGLGIFLLWPVVKKLSDKMRSDVIARHKAEAEARGEVYISSEEKAKLEKEEQAHIAEVKRIEELKIKCTKKGLNYQQEESQYQQKLAAGKAKQEAKRVKAEAKKRKNK